jgi:hypothetical protein
MLPLCIFWRACEIGNYNFLSLLNVSECVNREPPDVLVPGVLHVVSARVIDTRGLEEQTARAGVGNGLLETLLQALDGVGAAQDRIAIITTRRRDRRRPWPRPGGKASEYEPGPYPKHFFLLL